MLFVSNNKTLDIMENKQQRAASSESWHSGIVYKAKAKPSNSQKTIQERSQEMTTSSHLLLNK